MLERWDHEYRSDLPEEHEVWGEDPVICENCRHKWIAVHTLDTEIDDLECPLCYLTGQAYLVAEINLAELPLQ